MTEQPKVKFEYRSAQWGGEWLVFVVHEDTPAWWRVVARFEDQDRAESYSGMENDMAEMMAEDRDTTARQDEGAAPKELPAEPKTMIRRETIFSHERSTVHVREELPAPAPQPTLLEVAIETPALLIVPQEAESIPAPKGTWSEQEMGALTNFCEDGGDLPAFAKHLGRSEAAITQRAMRAGLYTVWQAAVRAKGLIPVPIVLEHDDGPITADDLSLRAQKLLFGILSAHEFKGGITDSAYAKLSEIENDGLGLLFDRLTELGCVIGLGNRWYITELGRTLIPAIRENIAKAG